MGLSLILLWQAMWIAVEILKLQMLFIWSTIFSGMVLHPASRRNNWMIKAIIPETKSSCLCPQTLS